MKTENMLSLEGTRMEFLKYCVQ